MSLNEVLKASKTNRFPDYWTLLWGRKLSASMIKTLTGTLPLIFKTSEEQLRDWTIYGNNYEHNYSAQGTLPLTFTTHTAGAASDWVIEGNNNIGKNMVNLDGVAQVTKGNVTVTADATTGYVTISTIEGEVTNTEATMQIYLPANISGDYYLSGSPNGGSETRTYDVYPWNETQSARPYKWDGTTQARSSIDSAPQEVQFVAGNIYRIGIRIRSGVAADGLVFRPMIRPADTSAIFEPYQIGVGQRTKNLFDSTIERGSYNNSTGNAESSDTRVRTVSPIMLEQGTYTVTANGVDNVLIRRYNLDGSYSVSLGAFDLPATFSTANEYKYHFVFRTYPTETEITPSDVTNIMLVEGSTAPDHYIPYGYEVPLTVSQSGQTDKTYDIYIGDSPLTAGQSISKTSTGVDIAAIAGSNTITTDLYNKPSMSIEGVDYVGVGEPTNDGWQIPLTVSDVTNTTTVNIPIDAPLTAGQSVSDTQTIEVFEGENTIDTTLYNKPTMEIKYK